jgi:hypothetical protein
MDAIKNNGFLNVVNGETITICPLQGSQLKITVNVNIFYINKLHENQIIDLTGIQRIKINCQIDDSLLSNAINEIKNAHDEFEEIWHKDYGEIDSGNLIDLDGDVSRLLDQVRLSSDWDDDSVRFDKILLRKQDSFDLSQFHTDHFNSYPPKIRKHGALERIIFNIGKNPRFFAVLNLNPSVVMERIHDPFSFEEYNNFFNDQGTMDLIIYETPGFNGTVLHGLKFNAYSTIHSGLGAKDDIAIVLSKWTLK